jgi:hypothetical protein
MAAFAKLAHWRGNETVPIEPDVWIGTLGQVQFSGQHLPAGLQHPPFHPPGRAQIAQP